MMYGSKLKMSKRKNFVIIPQYSYINWKIVNYGKKYVKIAITLVLLCHQRNDILFLS